MAICTKCGAQIDDNAAFCPVCGNQENAQQAQYQQPQYQQPQYQQPQYQQPQYQQPQYQYQQPYPYGQNPEDTGNAGWGVLGFFFPLVGLILFLVWKDTRPNDSKMAGKGALIRVIVGTALVVIYFVVVFLILGIGTASYYY
ncbi:MAG: zinc ribbon domain-containing protein [Clostridiales bacterium]|nr:zinc ribbon domain-containing protein [Clostridiales bacterium]